MKLIIDIPEEEYERIKDIPNDYKLLIHKAVANGTPLDDVKAEIEEMPTDYCGGYIGLDKKEVLQILDNIGKAESEDKE